ncbi:MAG: divergent PAP2 family protein [Candidatus Woesearchaeota archaeon]
MQQILIYVVLSFILGTLIKIITDIPKKRAKTSVYRYGGFPSVHALTVTSLATSVFLVEQVSSAFIVSLILGILVVRDINLRAKIDAIGSKTIKNYVPIAHTTKEIIGGVVLGVLIPVVLHLVL